MSIETNLSLGELRPVAGWLRTLPPAQRRDPCFRLYETGEQLALRLSRPAELHVTQAAAQALSTWAEGCIDDPLLLAPLLRVLLREPRLIEFVLLVHAAALLHATEMPRSQGFYPAVLLQEFLDDVDRRPASPSAVRLLWSILAVQHPEQIACIARSVAAWPRGYGASVWPSPEQARDLMRSLQELRPSWERLAGALLAALPAPTEPLPSAALGPDIASASPATQEAINRCLTELNRPAQRTNPARRLTEALGWPARALGLLGNLQHARGWLHVHLAYLQRIVPALQARARLRMSSGVPRLARHSNEADEACHGLNEVRETLSQDVVYAMAQGMESFAGQRVDMFSVIRPRPRAPGVSVEVHRKRLERQRTACLGGALDVVPPAGLDLIGEFAAAYFVDDPDEDATEDMDPWDVDPDGDEEDPSGEKERADE